MYKAIALLRTGMQHLADCIGRLRHEQQEIQSLRELQELEPHTLKDIGLSHDQLCCMSDQLSKRTTGQMGALSVQHEDRDADHAVDTSRQTLLRQAPVLNFHRRNHTGYGVCNEKPCCGVHPRTCVLSRW